MSDTKENKMGEIENQNTDINQESVLKEDSAGVRPRRIVLDSSKIEPVETAVILNASHRVKAKKHNKKEHKIESTSQKEMTQNKQEKYRASIVTSVTGIKLISALSYICFFLPLIFCRHEPYAIFHANQSLILWVTTSILYVLFWLLSINVLVLLTVMIFHILGLFFGIYNATHNRARSFFGGNKFYIFRP